MYFPKQGNSEESPKVKRRVRNAQVVSVSVHDGSTRWPNGAVERPGSPQHVRSVRVGCEVADEDGSWVACCVKNDGQGVLGEQIAAPRHSEPGALKDVPEQQQEISLEFCRAVVKAHGGTIWANTRAGWRAEFGFRLPIVRTVDAD